MKKLISLFCLITAASLNVSTVFAEKNQGQENRDAKISEVPFRLYKDYLILMKGSIGSLQDLTFLIDTGATTTVLSPHIASKLKLKQKSGKAAAYGKPVSIKSAIVRRLSLGSVLFHAIPVVIPGAFSMPSDLQLVDAIVGLNVLKRTNFSIDYESKKIRFGPVEHSRSAASFSSEHYLLGGKRWDAYPKGVDGVIGLAALKLIRLHFDFQNNVLSWERSTT